MPPASTSQVALCSQWKGLPVWRYELWEPKPTSKIINPGACETQCKGCNIALRAVEKDLAFWGKKELEVCAVVGEQDSLLYVYVAGIPSRPFFFGGIQGTPNPFDLKGLLPPTTISSIKVCGGRWLKECTTTHPSCLYSADPILPTRVLDLKPDGPSEVTLLETKGAIRGRYICLSYCRGTDAGFAKTTPDTYESHSRGIKPSDLPRTFRDAIRIARALKVRYLWIDALCIIQNDEDLKDWKQESGRMADVYRNSFLTLAVTWATSVHHGCFPQPRRSVEVGPLRVYEMEHPRKGARHNKAWSPFPLLGRAWAYQERLLAPRVLHIGPQELLWECRNNRSCECGGATYHLGELEKSDFYNITTNIKHADAPQLYRLMVGQYSALKTSDPRDRLPALSGLAEEMKCARQGETYLAGLWRETLVEDMCWYRRSGMPPSAQVSWRAPSWSWASIDGRVDYVLRLCHPLATQPLLLQHARVKDVQCTPVYGATDTGQVEDGFAELDSCLIPVALEKMGIYVKLKGQGNPGEPAQLGWCPDGTHEIDPDDEYYLIPMVTVDTDFHGLVVKFRDETKSEMVRIGLAKETLRHDQKAPTGERRIVRIV